MKKNRQSFLIRAGAFFRTAAARANRRHLVNEAYRDVCRLIQRDVPLADEYYFKGACAGLLETCGFIPSAFIREMARLEKGREAVRCADERSGTEVH